MSFMIMEWKVWAAIVTILFSPIRGKHTVWQSQTFWLVSVRETIQRVPYRHLTKEKDKIVIQFWARVKFRWNLNESVFWWAQNKAELNVHRVKIWSHCKVDPESVVLETTKLASMWNIVFRNPFSETLHLGWKSSLFVCVKVT